ncbi:hypothetical protein AKJ16_DCAP06962 [Drosera capensis]
MVLSKESVHPLQIPQTLFGHLLSLSLAVRSLVLGLQWGEESSKLSRPVAASSLPPRRSLLGHLLVLVPSGEKAEVEEELEEEVEDGSGEESDDETVQGQKGTEGIIEIENPNLVKPKLVKAKDIDRLKLIRELRAEAARKREEEKASKELKKAEARK